MNEISFCYGTLYNQVPECETCKYKRHCKNAGDLPLLTDRDRPEAITEMLIASKLPSRANRYERAERDRRYSRADLLEVITFMAALDIRSLALIADKLKDPDLNLSDLAGKRGISRQAVHKLVKQRLERIPELAAVLTYRRHKNKTVIHNPTFIEAVCRIQRETRETKLKRPKLASNFLRTWRYSKPSLLSSPMSILKGVAIWRKDLQP